MSEPDERRVNNKTRTEAALDAWYSFENNKTGQLWREFDQAKVGKLYMRMRAALRAAEILSTPAPSAGSTPQHPAPDRQERPSERDPK